MKNILEGKTVWITGASSGIGRALAIAFSDRGASCILSARSREGLIETNEMTKFPNRNRIEVLDITDHDTVSEAVNRVGGVDILINNAGISQRSIVEETNMDVYRRLMEVNYFGVINHTKLLLSKMIETGNGQIITISSIAGKVGPPYRSGYAASKHALHGFFDALRAEVTHKGIDVLMVCPGYINTPIAHNALSGSGEKYGKSDSENANGLKAEDLASRIIKAINKKETEIYFGQFEVNAARLKRFWPSKLTKMLHNKFIQDPKK